MGEPGVGKSALLADAVTGLNDAVVLRTQGLESESPMAFAALHRLLRPVLGHIGGPPAPQARALKVALGEEVGTVEPFLVALATLSILSDAAEERLVVCVVDDAHWLDVASADALLFVARRLAADRVAMVFSARGSGYAFAPEGVPVLHLQGSSPMPSARCSPRVPASRSLPRWWTGSPPRPAATPWRWSSSRPP